jgi:hypothetical protein
MNSMKKYSLLILCLALSGCASLQGGVPDVIDANRAAGRVRLGFMHSDPTYSDGTEINWALGASQANDTCRKWGYSGAEPLNRKVWWQGRYNGYGAKLMGTFYVDYQCTN